MKGERMDNQIQIMVKNGVAKNHRSLFIIVGDQGRNQVKYLYELLTKAKRKERQLVLWCSKKELIFSSDPKIRWKESKIGEEFHQFLSAASIHLYSYADTHKVLGNTYDMCVLQDFEALTPDLLAITTETVKGGGLVVILLPTMSSLKQLFTMPMDSHAKFCTDAHQNVVGRFNERFLLSLSSCENCVVINDQRYLIPISKHAVSIKPVPDKSLDEISSQKKELSELKKKLQEINVSTGKIIKLCRTVDQAQGFLRFVDSMVEKKVANMVVMTGARGRGKSATLGLAFSAAIAFGYTNMFVTAPSPENLKTLFKFIFKGFDALEYKEGDDYDIIQSTNPEFNNAVIRVNIFRNHRQTIQYIHPADCHKLGQAELLCIDEAAAIPLPLVKNLLGHYMVFMSSTINGYESSGKSLSVKLMEQASKQHNSYDKSDNGKKSDSSLPEIKLEEPIRYAHGDPVESWLNKLLCLDATKLPRAGCPLPSSCQLYYVNRNALFSYHSGHEKFLHQIMALYASSDYQNCANGLQVLSDAPEHYLFVLLSPSQPKDKDHRDVLCLIHVCLEGEIHSMSQASCIQKEQKTSDLIPWTVSYEFQNTDFLALSGARIVKIVTHPDHHKMGYGTAALDQLQKYYEGYFLSLKESTDELDDHTSGNSDMSIQNDKVTEENSLLSEQILPRKNVPPLLVKLTDRRPEALQYLGVSFALTPELYRFWKKSGYTPVSVRRTQNELIGKHSCIMLKPLNTPTDEVQQPWLQSFWKVFQKRFIRHLPGKFRGFNTAMALEILENGFVHNQITGHLNKSDLLRHLTVYDIKRLDLYSQNLVDYHLVCDLLLNLARLYFTDHVNVSFISIQSLILLALGLQRKTVEETEKELQHFLPNQILSQVNKIICKFVKYFNEILEKEAEATIAEKKEIVMDPLRQSMTDELAEAGKEFRQQHKKDVASLLGFDLSQYAIKGSENDWSEAMKGPGKSHSLISIKSHLVKKRKLEEAKDADDKKHKSGKKKKNNYKLKKI